MLAEEIPSAVSYQSLVEVLGKKPLVGYSLEERVECTHLMQSLKHLQSKPEYRALLASQINEDRQRREELAGLTNWWKALGHRVGLFFQRALNFLCLRALVAKFAVGV
jgi:hypothetical protein